MRKAWFVCLAMVFLASTFAIAAGGSPPQEIAANPSSPMGGNSSAIKATLPIDNFDDGNISLNPEWWTFDKIVPKAVENKTGNADLGKYYLNIKGQAKDWYVGGMGTYLAADASKYSNFSIDVEGQGEGSGLVKIELYEDDNRNMEIEQDKKFQPLYDDRWTYEAKVDWTGWQRVSIPFSDFKDTNPKKGDNIWNPDKKNGSGGLLHVQIIFVAGEKTGSVDLNIDNVKLTKE